MTPTATVEQTSTRTRTVTLTVDEPTFALLTRLLGATNASVLKRVRAVEDSDAEIESDRHRLMPLYNEMRYTAADYNIKRVRLAAPNSIGTPAGEAQRQTIAEANPFPIEVTLQGGGYIRLADRADVVRVFGTIDESRAKAWAANAESEKKLDAMRLALNSVNTNAHAIADLVDDIKGAYADATDA